MPVNANVTTSTHSISKLGESSSAWTWLQIANAVRNDNWLENFFKEINFRGIVRGFIEQEMYIFLERPQKLALCESFLL